MPTQRHYGLRYNGGGQSSLLMSLIERADYKVTSIGIGGTKHWLPIETPRYGGKGRGRFPAVNLKESVYDIGVDKARCCTLHEDRKRGSLAGCCYCLLELSDRISLIRTTMRVH